MTTSNSLMINPCKVLKKVSERDRPRKAEIKQDKNAEGRKDGNVNKWKDNKEKIRDIEKIDANSVVQEDEIPNPSLYTFRSEKFDEVTDLSTSCYAYVADVTETAIIKEEKILINKDTATSAEKGTVFPLLPPAKILSDIATWTKAENSTTISDNELIIEYQDVCKTINKNENLVIQMNNSQFSNIHESIPEETIQDVNNDFNKSEVEENSIGDSTDCHITKTCEISVLNLMNCIKLKGHRENEIEKPERENLNDKNRLTIIEYRNRNIFPKKKKVKKRRSSCIAQKNEEVEESKKPDKNKEHKKVNKNKKENKKVKNEKCLLKDKSAKFTFNKLTRTLKIIFLDEDSDSSTDNINDNKKTSKNCDNIITRSTDNTTMQSNTENKIEVISKNDQIKYPEELHLLVKYEENEMPIISKKEENTEPKKVKLEIANKVYVKKKLEVPLVYKNEMIQTDIGKNKRIQTDLAGIKKMFFVLDLDSLKKIKTLFCYK